MTNSETINTARKAETIFHHSYWVLMACLGLLSLYFFVGVILPSTWFTQSINVDSGGGAVNMSFTTEFNGEGTGSIVNTMNCTSDLLLKETKVVEVLPYIYKEIEVTKPILTGIN